MLVYNVFYIKPAFSAFSPIFAKPFLRISKTWYSHVLYCSVYETENHNSSHRLKPKRKLEAAGYQDTDYLRFMQGGSFTEYNYLDPNYMPASWMNKRDNITVNLYFFVSMVSRVWIGMYGACMRSLSLSQTTNFRLFQTERVCRQQLKIWWKWWKVLLKDGKCFGKRRNCLLTNNFSFSQCFQKTCPAHM